ncbi:hypothetical protein DFH08DRAFT_822034 [Mycena albidolilacea]|uniref:Uncharacterized protein n=1 Tax=Mycena albidolilacea TaxID=1033008 RepID=A0AAD6Z963_9AGAR|nr:hypothetical protein DFH08DRAFT_822034 [Mycena albidolilacea]
MSGSKQPHLLAVPAHAAPHTTSGDDSEAQRTTWVDKAVRSICCQHGGRRAGPRAQREGGTRVAGCRLSQQAGVKLKDVESELAQVNAGGDPCRGVNHAHCPPHIPVVTCVTCLGHTFSLPTSTAPFHVIVWLPSLDGLSTPPWRSRPEEQWPHEDRHWSSRGRIGTHPLDQKTKRYRVASHSVWGLKYLAWAMEYGRARRGERVMPGATPRAAGACYRPHPRANVADCAAPL